MFERIDNWWSRQCGGREVLATSLPLIVLTVSVTVMVFIDRMFLLLVLRRGHGRLHARRDDPYQRAQPAHGRGAVCEYVSRCNTTAPDGLARSAPSSGHGIWVASCGWPSS